MLGVISIENAIASSHVNSASSAWTDAQSLVLGNFRDTPGRSGIRPSSSSASPRSDFRMMMLSAERLRDLRGFRAVRNYRFVGSESESLTGTRFESRARTRRACIKKTSVNLFERQSQPLRPFASQDHRRTKSNPLLILPGYALDL